MIHHDTTMYILGVSMDVNATSQALLARSEYQAEQRCALLHPFLSQEMLGDSIPRTFLVGGDWNMTFMTSHSVGNVIIPIDSYFSDGWLNHQPDLVYLVYV